MKNKQQLVPSLLSFDKNSWSYYFLLFEKANLEYIHFDVMDKEYVNHTAFNEKDFKKFVHNFNNLKAHVHLMVMDPLKEVEKYFHKKTKAISFHFDVYKNPNDVIKCLEKIKAVGIKAGIAVSPHFNIWNYEQYLMHCDFITMMGVHPGLGGQPFNVECLQNLQELKTWSIENNKDFLIEVDGGMDLETMRLVAKDCQFIVSGSFLAKNIDKLNEIVEDFDKLQN